MANSTFNPRSLVLPAALILMAVLVASVLFVLPDPQVFPMGDAYIHFVYARNLSQFGEFAYNLGVAEGIGTSSVLWVLLLAVFTKLGISTLVAARVLGIALLAVTGLLCFDLTCQLLGACEMPRRRSIALLIALTCVVSGNVLWIALSGMETILFLALGLLVLSTYVRGRYVLTGIGLGCLALARFEGLALAAVILAVELLRAPRHRLVARLAAILLPAVLLLVPWIGYLQLHGGAPLMTTYVGKQVSSAQVTRVLQQGQPAIQWLLQQPLLVYPAAWLGYILLLLYGGVSFPGPALHVPGPWAGIRISVPLLALGLLILFVIPLLLRSVAVVWRRRASIRLSSPRHRLALVILGWFLLHNLAYALFLPQPGAAGRYAPMNQFVLWSALLASSLWLSHRWTRAVAVSIVFLMLGASLLYWRAVYRANVDYTRLVRIPAAQYVDARCAADTAVGTTDLGPLRYYARQEIVDLFGFVNQDVPRLLQEDRGFSNYLVERDIRCLYLFMPSAGVGIDSVDLLNIGNDSRFHLQEAAGYSVPVDDWVLGVAPVSNYMPRISVFKVLHDPAAKASGD